MSTPPELPPVEVVLVTGPAGSGKTAFISACAAALRDDKTRKNVGYMSHRFVQEFGCTAPLPQPLARAVAESGFYSSVFDFGSGCVCCSPSGDFQRALSSLPSSRVCPHEAPEYPPSPSAPPPNPPPRIQQYLPVRRLRRLPSSFCPGAADDHRQ